MKTSILKFVMFLFVVNSNNSFPQLEEDWFGYKVSIPFIRILEVKPILEPSRNIAYVYPEERHYHIAGFIYTLELTISISGDKEDFDAEIPIVFKTPTNEEYIFIFNSDRYPLKSNRLYDFVYELKTKKKGYTQIGLMRKFSDSPIPIAIYENGLRLE